MKLSLRKVFSIVMASLGLLGFIFTFIAYLDVAGGTYNLWNIPKYNGDKCIVYGLFMLFIYAGIITMYLLHLFGVVKEEKWFKYLNYGTGYAALFHLTFLFQNGNYLGAGAWLGAVVGIGLLTCSILWYIFSDEPFTGNKGKITGYDPKTGKPIYAKPKGFDPKTGKPIFDEE